MLPTVFEASEALVAVFEGERLVSYQDPGGIWTIGIGHTQGVHGGTMCTHEQAMEWFAQDDEVLFSLVTQKPLLEAMAYISFGFNCGKGALEKVLSGAVSICDLIYTTDREGRFLPGLITRRRLEYTLIAISQG